MGVLGWSHHDATTATPASISRALWWREFYERADWERMRILAFCALSPHAKKGKLKRPSDVMPFPWDNDGTTPKTAEEIRAEVARIKAFWDQQDSKQDSKNVGIGS